MRVPAGRTVLALGLIAGTTIISACSRDRALVCGPDSIYLDARTIGALQVPDDLSVPDASASLRIPEVVIAVDAAADDTCLEYSPAYQVPRPDES